MPKLSKRVIVLVLLFLFIVLASSVYLKYLEQKNAFEREMEVLSFGFRKASDGFLDVDAIAYTDVVAMRVPIMVKNSGQGDVRLGKVRFRIALEGRTLEERELSLAIPPAGSREVVLERVRLETKILDEILASKEIDVARPEEAFLALRIDALLPYTVKAFGVRLFETEVPVTFEGDVLVRKLMGGKSVEEAALGFKFE